MLTHGSNVSIIFQLSTPRTGSNITCRFLGGAADGCSVTPGIDTPTGVQYEKHIKNAMANLPSKENGETNVLYMMEHSACLSSDQLREMKEVSEIFLITVRDPSLVLESLVRKLVLNDLKTGIRSRVEIHVEEICKDKSERGLLAENLCEENGQVKRAALYEKNYSEAARKIMDSNARKKGFKNWQALQDEMTSTKNYRLAEDVLAITHPDLRRGLANYPSPQHFITENPFDFMRSCMGVTRKFINNEVSKRVLILDSGIFRVSPEFRMRIIEEIGISKENVRERMLPQDISKANIAEEAVVFMNRALSSDRIEKPYETPIDPTLLPSFLIEKNGLFWELVDHYTESVLSTNYIRPRQWTYWKEILDCEVKKEEGESIKLWEKNPIFAFLNVLAVEDGKGVEKDKRLKEIREFWSGMSTVFDYIQNKTIIPEPVHTTLRQ